jgi:Phage ABA sandwich domain
MEWEEEKALNERVAREIMNPQPRVTWAILNSDETATMISFDRESEARKWFDEHVYAQKDSHVGSWQHWPPYSSDISAAMEVVEKMWEKGYQAEIVNHYKLNTLVADNVCIWWVRFINVENDMDNWSAESESLPEAICLAALATLKKGE